MMMPPTFGRSACTLTANSTAQFASTSSRPSAGSRPPWTCLVMCFIPSSIKDWSSSNSTRFVADPEKARTFPELPYVTVRLGSTAGVHFNADYGLAMVRPEHMAFYRRVFLHEAWSEPRIHPGLLKPVGLMAAHLPAVRERVLARYPFLRSSAFERRMLFERGRSRSGTTDVRPSFAQASIVPSS